MLAGRTQSNRARPIGVIGIKTETFDVVAIHHQVLSFISQKIPIGGLADRCRFFVAGVPQIEMPTEIWIKKGPNSTTSPSRWAALAWGQFGKPNSAAITVKQSRADGLTPPQSCSSEISTALCQHARRLCDGCRIPYLFVKNFSADFELTDCISHCKSPLTGRFPLHGPE